MQRQAVVVVVVAAAGVVLGLPLLLLLHEEVDLLNWVDCLLEVCQS